jgi:membrane protease YdiL (CAAX protease family)
VSVRPRIASESAQLAAYFGLAFAISWSCWLPAAFSADGVQARWVRMLVYAGIAGPAVATLALLHLNGTRAQREEFWDRVWNVGRLRAGWILPVVLVYPLLTAIAAGVDRVLFGGAADASRLVSLLSSPLVMLVHLVMTFALGPFPEELGWRGYALDRLQARRTALGASLLLGTAWAAWHLPLFFVKGSYQNGLGFGSMGFWLYGLTAVSASVLFTCVYNSSDRSVLSAILLHGVLNSTRGVVELSPQAELFRTSFLAALAIGVVVLVGGRTLNVGVRGAPRES